MPEPTELRLVPYREDLEELTAILEQLFEILERDR